MSLLDTMALKPGDVAALVGGGGKTTLMFALAHEAMRRGSVITTTTTKIAVPAPDQSPTLIVDASEEGLETRWRSLRDQVRHATLAASALEDRQKLAGVRPEFVDRLAAGAAAELILVEADGAKQRSLKAPDDKEPVIPRATTQLVAVLGIDAVGLPFNDRTVFRYERARRLVGSPPGNIITPEWAAALVAHPEGICKGAPHHARMVFLINKVDTPEAEGQAKILAAGIRRYSLRPIAAIFAGSLRRAEATGQSSIFRI